jgi:hypothetical protein
MVLTQFAVVGKRSLSKYVSITLATWADSSLAKPQLNTNSRLCAVLWRSRVKYISKPEIEFIAKCDTPILYQVSKIGSTWFAINNAHIYYNATYEISRNLINVENMDALNVFCKETGVPIKPIYLTPGAGILDHIDEILHYTNTNYVRN